EDQDEDEDEDEPPGDDPLQQLLGGVPAGEDPDLDALIERLTRAMGEEEGGDAAEAAADALEQVTQAAADGAIETDRVARQLERFLPGIGWSTAPGQLELALLDRLDQLARLLQELSALDTLADELGRLEEASRREGKRQGGREEVVGVRLGGEVSHALPAELALLGDPATEDLFYMRLLERRLVSLELTGQGDEGVAQGDRRGPVIACIDTSASMEGPPELAAKALVLAVCRKVIPKGRAVHLILFGGPGERTELRLRRGLGGLEGMLAFLQRSFHSGTDFDGPLLRAMDLLDEAELEAADVLVVTDGLCRAAPDVVDRVRQVRDKRGVKVWSVVLGHRDTRGVDPFSDEVLRIDPTQAASAANLVRGL
ncbi:MAG: VWA domain-containing protein, partial [Myxococcota bacterium]